MLYGFVAGTIIGRVSVRHELNERLRQRGGHIGYAVAPRFRRRGFATDMVRQALDYCRSLALRKIMITCDDNNEASCRIIEKFGGNLQDKVSDEENRTEVRRYWLALR